MRRLLSKASIPPAAENGPIVSFVVIVYDMAEQAKKTVISLGPDYQQDVVAKDYEVIIVENESANPMNTEFIEALGDGTRYYLRKDAESTPVPAIEFGASKARGKNICVMIDGARMLTPGVVKNIILGHRLFDQAVVSIPGYHLGSKLQQKAVDGGYGVEEEQSLVGSINWPADGYRLFEIACFSGSCVGGFFLPNSESNCISMPRKLWAELGGCDPAFAMRGGGLVNLDLYKRACEFPGVRHVIIPGEGTFHQFHGGVTTGGEEEKIRDAYIDASKEQYRQLRGQYYSSPRSNPILLGQFPHQAMKFMHYSTERALRSRRDSSEGSV